MLMLDRIDVCMLSRLQSSYSQIGHLCKRRIYVQLSTVKSSRKHEDTSMWLIGTWYVYVIILATLTTSYHLSAGRGETMGWEWRV